MNWLQRLQAPAWRTGDPLDHPFAEHHWYSLDGTPLLLRPAGAGDAAGLAEFWRSQAPHSRRLRFHGGVQVAADTAAKPAADTFVVQAQLGQTPRLVAHACVSPGHARDSGEAEFALSVDDRWQRRGLGRRMLRMLMQVAQARGHQVLCAEVLKDNVAMRRLLAHESLCCGLNDHGGPVLRAEIPLHALTRDARRDRRAGRATRAGWFA